MSHTNRQSAPHYFRKPKTQNELRQVENALEEGVHVRPARQEKHLPDAWDDKPVSAAREKVKRRK